MNIDTLLEIIAKVTLTKTRLVEASTVLVELNFDSLAQLGFIAEADSAGFVVDAQKLASAKTVQDLIDLFE